MRNYEDTEVWRRCVALKKEIYRMCEVRGDDLHEETVADYKRTCDILCDSIRDAFRAVDKDGVSVCLIVAGGKVGRLSGFLEVGVIFELADKEWARWIFGELREIRGMIDIMICEINDGFWFEGFFD